MFNVNSGLGRWQKRAIGAKQVDLWCLTPKNQPVAPMQKQICEEKLIEIFIAVDDFVKLFDQRLTTRSLVADRKPTRKPQLTASEIITLLVY